MCNCIKRYIKSYNIFGKIKNLFLKLKYWERTNFWFLLPYLVASASMDFEANSLGLVSGEARKLSKLLNFPVSHILPLKG